MDKKIRKNNEKFNNQRNALKTAPSDMGYSYRSLEKGENRKYEERRV